MKNLRDKMFRAWLGLDVLWLECKTLRREF
jgi:hypothetical protein